MITANPRELAAEARNIPLNREILCELLNYDKLSGDFTWRTSGKLAGYINNGIRCVKINNKRYSIPRLVYLWTTGNLPDVVYKIKKADKDIFENLSLTKGRAPKIKKEKYRISNPITREDVTHFLDYERESGELTWKMGCYKGKPARRTILKSRGDYISFGKRRYPVRRLIVLLETGELLTKKIHFKNGNSSDNRFSNLFFEGKQNDQCT